MICPWNHISAEPPPSRFMAVCAPRLTNSSCSSGRVFPGAIDAHGEVAVLIHNQHVAGGIVCAQQLAVADDGAVLVHAVIIGVDGQNSSAAGGHSGYRFRIAKRLAVAQRGLKLRNAGQLHIRHKVDDAVFIIAADDDLPVVAVIGIIIGPLDAGRLEGGAFAGSRGKGEERKQQGKAKNETQLFHVSFHLEGFPFAFVRRFRRQGYCTKRK